MTDACRVAVLTGAASGTGLGIARDLADLRATGTQAAATAVDTPMARRAQADGDTTGGTATEAVVLSG